MEKAKKEAPDMLKKVLTLTLTLPLPLALP